MNIMDRMIFVGYGPYVREFTVADFLQSKRVGPGWNDLLLQLFERLFALGWDGKLSDCKEKFGTLRFHFSLDRSQHIDDCMWDIVQEYEQRSATICEFCGHFPASARHDRHWIKTMCDECRAKDGAENPTMYKKSA